MDTFDYDSLDRKKRVFQNPFMIYHVKFNYSSIHRIKLMIMVFHMEEIQKGETQVGEMAIQA